MVSSLLLHLFFVCLLINLFDLVLTQIALSESMVDESSILRLSIYPNAGVATAPLQLRCEILQPTSKSPLSSTSLDNVFLVVKTNIVTPSGILVKFDDANDECRTDRNSIRIEICNASLILVHVSHTILNETIDKIDYSCNKGSAIAMSSYRIKKNLVGRYYDQYYNSSTFLSHSSFVLVLFLFVSRLTMTPTATTIE